MSHRVSAGPPPISIFFSFPGEKNAMKRLSGDQKGSRAPSVPGKIRAAIESRSRTHSESLPPSLATNARWRPSGERAGTLLVSKFTTSIVVFPEAAR